MKTVRFSWLINPYVDFSFFIAAPLAIVPAFQLLVGWFSLTALKLGVLSVSATGHHLPGFIRAYTDGKIFNQYRARLILVPALLILSTVVAAYLKLTLIFYVLIVWSAWHGSMQIHGFLRIYDVRAKFLSPSTARVDFWMCIAWFVQVVLWSTAKKTSVLTSFYMSGGPLIPVEWMRTFEKAWFAFTLAVTAAYLIQSAANIARHRYFNLPKFLCMVFSFGFWAYCLIGIPHLIVGLILWEIFHDLQYNVFVWNYNRNRVKNGLSQSAIEKFLFQWDARKVLFYALCIVVYGSVGLLTQDIVNTYENQKTYGNLLYQIGNVFAASALIHFYTDGFIWKIRDGKVQADLGMSSANTYHASSSGKHWFFVSFFFIAAAGLGASEYFGWNADQQGLQSSNLVKIVPKSGYVNFLEASRLQGRGQLDSAIEYYRLAMAADSNYNFNLPVVAELYVATGQFENAEKEYRNLLAQDSLNAEYAFQLAWSLLQRKKGIQAKPYLELTLRLDSLQPRALNYLGMVEQAGGNSVKAEALYRKALALDSTYGHARENLSALEQSEERL